MKTPTKKQEAKQDGGCPCGMRGACCKKPQLYTPAHTCSDEAICEDCYGLACRNCGSLCYHEL